MYLWDEKFNHLHNEITEIKKIYVRKSSSSFY